MGTKAATRDLTMELLAKSGPMRTTTPLSRNSFIELAGQFPEFQMEHEKNGIVVIMSPVKKGSGEREVELLLELGLWNRKYGQGAVYGSSVGFALPDGSVRSPDAAWISPERVEANAGNEHDDEYMKTVPNFVVEIRSSTDRLSTLKKKMTETWLANGVRLAWLIDPYGEKVYIYRQDRDVEIASKFDTLVLSGENVVPGFELPLAKFKAVKN